MTWQSAILTFAILGMLSILIAFTGVLVKSNALLLSGSTSASISFSMLEYIRLKWEEFEMSKWSL